jgi:predicted lipid-binding transport protein (Tim44 family)
MLTLKSRRGRAAVALGLALTLAAGIADARPGGGSSSGSRGSRTYSTPPSTATAPSTARPIERSTTQPGPQMQRPGAPVPQPQVAQPRRFGFGTGLMAGLLGAGLIGMLMGNGFLGGLAGLASIIGLLFQVALIGGLIWLAVRFFRRRSEPALASAGAPYARQGLGDTTQGLNPASGGAAPRASSAGRDEIGIGPRDYAAFEETLTAIQMAYGREDLNALRSQVTPEMAGYFAEELEANRSRGVVNKISDVRLLQGDLAEAWREGPTDYATVAMRYQLVDATVERATGRVVKGNLNAPTEATEIWTFRRDRGGPWLLSAIQQTS